ncbi:MAG: hypothetical protein HY718_00805 [Planctomycetes bacterium]|nr:hypothetical protein [Planctomycetota bacterium]
MMFRLAEARTLSVCIGVVLAAANLRAETNALPFYDRFEPGWSFQAEWHAFDYPGGGRVDCPSDWTQPHSDYCPYDPSNAPNIPAPGTGASWTWGPYKFETWPDKDNGGRVFSGQRSGRQPIWDPMWGAIYHIFTPPPAGKDLRLKVQIWDEAGILCDCDQQSQPIGYVCNCNNLPPPNPSRTNFDVHGGIELGAPYRRASYSGSDKEFYFLGVNTKRSWDRYCWTTAADGWVVTDVPRTRGWHEMQIVVHPYTGNLGDVEFWMDGVRIARGHRMPGTGSGADVIYLHLGGDPALITESHLTNTFEEFWYDEVALTACHDPRPDADGDGDVDAIDFAGFQNCITPEADPFLQSNALFDPVNCQCFDLDGDQDVDSVDLDGFVACASGPALPADPDCDH